MSLGGSEMAHAVPVHSMCLGSSSPSLSVGLVCDCCAGPDEARADPPPASCTLHSRPAGRQNRVFGRMDKTCEMTCKLLDSPVGKIEISGCALGLHGLKLLGQKPLQANPSEAPAGPEDLGGPGKVPEPLIQCASWLKAYFYKPAGIDELPLPAIHHPTFQKDSFTRQVLWKLLKVVKFGDTVSYQQLAVLAGHPKAARAVGGIMRSNPLPIIIPCHRVVYSSGAPGSYSGGPTIKGWLLAHEGGKQRADLGVHNSTIALPAPGHS
ncbi:methylated-DNA--protein-cysteine methyltransferase isoform X2 [Tamandua tetradactyla]|uniref:methylated-DNA--protein-cysteine methyltransferase isoform X2 n=1 Tax=Tamandua tetradactyla TaxID=48850 RepID=UPI00405440E1